MSLRELETAVTKLPSEDLNIFAQWFQEYLSDTWDSQIEADLKAGRLDAAMKKADQEVEAGRVTPL